MIVVGVIVVAVLVLAFVVRRGAVKEQQRQAQAIAVPLAPIKKRRSDLGTKRPRKVKEYVENVTQPVPSGEAYSSGSNNTEPQNRGDEALSLPPVFGFPAEPFAGNDGGGSDPVGSPSLDAGFQGGESGGAGASGSWDPVPAVAESPSYDGGASASDSGSYGGGSSSDSGKFWEFRLMWASIFRWLERREAQFLTLHKERKQMWCKLPQDV